MRVLQVVRGKRYAVLVRPQSRANVVPRDVECVVHWHLCDPASETLKVKVSVTPPLL
jgi:hypothetical protein